MQNFTLVGSSLNLYYPEMNTFMSVLLVCLIHVSVIILHIIVLVYSTCPFPDNYYTKGPLCHEKHPPTNHHPTGLCVYVLGYIQLRDKSEPIFFVYQFQIVPLYLLFKDNHLKIGKYPIPCM